MTGSPALIDRYDGTTGKNQCVEGIGSEHPMINPYQVDDFKLRISQNTALLTHTNEMNGTCKGKAFTSHDRHTDVYVNANGASKAVNIQTTRIK